jgi:hypothetical protein
MGILSIAMQLDLFVGMKVQGLVSFANSLRSHIDEFQ